ncbi:MAG: hypothetical protein GX455_15295 [Phycisphaerae bacterium]|nr:hypothetical protein [Phycisphaerae bacterium]
MKHKHIWIGVGIVTILHATGWGIGETLNYPIQRLESAGPVASVTQEGRKILSLGVGSQGGQPGAPMLPATTYRLLIPADARDISAALADAVWETLDGQWEIDAVPPAATNEEARTVLDWGTADTARIHQGRDLAIYESDLDYPAEPLQLVSVGELSGYKIAEVKIVWAAYNPVRKSVRLLRSGTIQIHFARGDNLAIPPPSQARVDVVDTLADLIDNSQDIEIFDPTVVPPAPADSIPPPPATYNYVIITTEYILQNSKQLPCFIALKQMQGFSVKVVTEATTSDETHYAGGASAEERADNIRQWLRSRYLSQGFQYVLLVGNPHPLTLSARSVPMRWCKPRNTFSYSSAPSDMYFAELSNTWDKDGDGLVGEFSGDYGSGGADKTCELKVGRIPVFGTIDELDRILSGTMDYIVASTDQSWRRKLLVAAAVSNFSPQDNNGDGDASDSDDIGSGYRTFGDGWGEALKSKAQDLSYYAYTLYEKSGCKTDGSAFTTKTCNAPLTMENLIDEWEHGYGFVSWWGHGNSGGAYRMIWQRDNYNIGTCNEPTEAEWTAFFNQGCCVELNESRRAFVAEVSCLNGQPAGPNLASSLLIYGSVGAFAGTSVTWYKVGGWGTDQGEDYADNASFGYYLFRRMAEFGDTAGAALNWCRSHFGTGWSSGASWMNMLSFTLHGDPSLSLTTNYPNLAPLPPIDLQARHVSGQIHLTWGDNSRNETGFRIQYKSDPQIWPYSWYDLATVPENTTSFQYTCLVGTKYYFRLCAYNANGESAYTDTVEITPMMELKTIGITSPNGGETLVSGQIHTIRWTNYNNPAAQVTIHLSTDGGSSWRQPPIVTNLSNAGTNKSFDWVVPNIHSSRCVLRVADASDGWPYDLSDAFFTITPMPDLVIESIALDPPQPMLGQPCTVKVTVRNQGMADSGSFWIDWYANRTTPPQPGDPPNVSEIRSLAAGKRYTTGKSFTFGYSGPLRMYAIVDQDKIVSESDETNNLLGPVAGVAIDFEVLFDEANALGWFGGDDREEFKPRNVGAGQQIQLGRTSHVTQAAFRFKGKFDYHQDPTGYGHEVTLALDLRDGEGDSIQRVLKTIDPEFRGGWIDFDLDRELWPSVSYTFTCSLQDGGINELYNGITGYVTDRYPHSQGYSAVGHASNADLDNWSNWQEHPWEYNFRLRGYRTDRLCVDRNGDHAVALSDLRWFAENWLQSPCSGIETCGGCDCDGSGGVDLEDYALLAFDYGRSVFPWSYWQRFTIGNREAMMSNAMIRGSDGSEFWPGTTFIYKTNAGRFGQIRVQAYDPATQQLTMEWITYQDNGVPYSSGQGLIVGASYTCDLDAGAVPGETAADWHWNLTTSTTRYLRPLNGAKFLMVLRPTTPY